MNQPTPILPPPDDHHYMRQALTQAQHAYTQNETPIGAIITHQNTIIARAHNQVELLKDATAHAEMLALTQAQNALGDWRLNHCTLYTTKEPCPMCAGANLQTRIQRLVYGAPDPKTGAAGGAINLLQNPQLNHHCQIQPHIQQTQCTQLLKKFFQTQRTKNNTPPNQNNHKKN